MISFDHVEFAYDRHPIFSGLSFHLDRGRYLVVSGPTRSGKTTIVQLISGLLLPASGEVSVEGESTVFAARSRKRLRDLRRKIGGVGGIYSLLTDRTILENVALSAEIAGYPSRMARKNALEACGKYRLTHVLSRHPDRVSEVERRAALMARAEAARKDLIVADSPADGLDEKSAGYIHDRLAALRLAGITILYLTSGSGPETGPDGYLRLIRGGAEP
jgi:ABC-type ATPase involved in cell division